MPKVEESRFIDFVPSRGIKISLTVFSNDVTIKMSLFSKRYRDERSKYVHDSSILYSDFQGIFTWILLGFNGFRL
jgi:hypothetical protein